MNKQINAAPLRLLALSLPPSLIYFYHLLPLRCIYLYLPISINIFNANNVIIIIIIIVIKIVVIILVVILIIICCCLCDDVFEFIYFCFILFNLFFVFVCLQTGRGAVSVTEDKEDIPPHTYLISVCLFIYF